MSIQYDVCYKVFIELMVLHSPYNHILSRKDYYKWPEGSSFLLFDAVKDPRTFFDIESYDVPEMYQCRLHEPGKPSLKNCGNGEFQYCYVTRPTEKKVRKLDPACSTRPC